MLFPRSRQSCGGTVFRYLSQNMWKLQMPLHRWIKYFSPQDIYQKTFYINAEFYYWWAMWLHSGEKGIGKGTQKPLHYKGCLFHRIVKDFMIQGGDFSEGELIKVLGCEGCTYLRTPVGQAKIWPILRRGGGCSYSLQVICRWCQHLQRTIYLNNQQSTDVL